MRPYDVVAGWLVALLILTAYFVLMMFLVWMTYAVVVTEKQANVVLVERIEGRGDHAVGMERDITAPGAEEMEEETEAKVERLLEAVTHVVSTQAAALDSMATDATSSNSGTELGDDRKRGPLGEGDDAIPRYERWQIQYNSTSLDDYARQLDYFGIELGAVGGGIQHVDYVQELAGSPKVRSGPGDEEQRLYMTWNQGNLKKFDEALLAKGGIRTGARIVLQFYPRNIENELAVIEKEYGTARGYSSYTNYRRTVFGVRRQGNGFEYYVVSQLYRQP